MKCVHFISFFSSQKLGRDELRVFVKEFKDILGKFSLTRRLNISSFEKKLRLEIGKYYSFLSLALGLNIMKFFSSIIPQNVYLSNTLS